MQRAALLSDKFMLTRLLIAELLVCVLFLPVCLIAESKSEKPQWSIGIFEGSSPARLQDNTAFNNPVLTAADITDRSAEFVADPFLFPYKGKWLLFFEVMTRGSKHGDIGLAVSRDLINWKYKAIVLDEDFHLSYPFVFKHKSFFYMIPETRRRQAIRLYRASNFPFGWHHVKTLIRGNFADPSPVFYEDKWWIFAVQGGYSLVAFYADNLFGRWRGHPLNPIYKDEKWRARPAGRPLVLGNQLLRFAQDNRERYGHRVRGFAVKQLDGESFVEQELAESPVLEPHAKGWRGNGMHHVDAWRTPSGRWIAAVDGSGWEAKE